MVPKQFTLNRYKAICIWESIQAKKWTSANEGMIAGAINVPFDAVEVSLDKLPKDKTIALYCNTVTKSGEVAK